MTYDQEREENINGFHHAHLVEGQIDGPHHAMRSRWLPLLAVADTSQPTGAFTDKWVEYLPDVGGSYIRATGPVPVGLQCRFMISCTANSGGGTAWSIAITIVDLYDHVLKDYAIASTLVSVDLSQTGKLVNNLTNTPWVMPNHDLNLSFHLFASFDASPDQSLLQSGDPSMYF